MGSSPSRETSFALLDPRVSTRLDFGTLDHILLQLGSRVCYSLGISSGMQYMVPELLVIWITYISHGGLPIALDVANW